MASSLILPPASAPLATGAARPVALLNDRGDPQPPADILNRLKGLHPAFGMRFADGIGGSGWAVTWEWPENDKRRAWIREGKYDPNAAYDRIGYLPFGCSVDQAAGYIERAFKAYPRDEIRKFAEATRQWNAVELPAQQIAEAVVDTVADTLRAARQQNPRRTRVTMPKGDAA